MPDTQVRLVPSITDLGELPREVARRTGYKIVSHRFDFYGICPQCQENSN